MISQTVDYAMRAVVCLAHHIPEAQTTDQIASMTKVPRAYLAKVLQSLSRAGIVSTQRGIGGGISLLKDTTEVTMLDILNAVDPLERITSCPLKLQTHGFRLCALHRRLDDALANIQQAFRETTLHDILTEPAPVTPLCDMPHTLKVRRQKQLV